MKNITSTLILFSILLLSSPLTASAHPGNTDSSGCHTCRTNCSSWGLYTGEYHCHNNKGTSQPESPIHSRYGSGGTGYTVPAPDYAYPSIPTTPSCPLMSYYDSLSGSCKCNYGYVVGTDILGEQSCVSGTSKCQKDYGYGAQYDSLSNQCECRYGYVMSGSQCISESSYCENILGDNARFNSLLEKCECKMGYAFDGSDCVEEEEEIVCPINSYAIGDRCYCNSGYALNSNSTGCVAVPAPVIVKEKIVPIPAPTPTVRTNVKAPTTVEQKKPEAPKMAPLEKKKSEIDIRKSKVKEDTASTSSDISTTTEENMQSLDPAQTSTKKESTLKKISQGAKNAIVDIFKRLRFW